MSSLNDGFELDDELIENKKEQPVLISGGTEVSSINASEFADTVFKDTRAGVIPELREDSSVVTAVNTIEDLGDLKKSIITSDGMNKTFALEADKLIPGFLNEDVPIEFYTSFPSKTNYKFALESIDKQIQSLKIKLLADPPK